MTFSKNVLVAGLAVLAIMEPAFANGKSKAPIQKKIVDVSHLFNGGLTNQPRPDAKKEAAELVQAGEELLLPGGAIYADDLFNVALQIDPSNLKAQLYRRLLGPIREFHGAYRRSESLSRQTESRARHAQWLKDKREMERTLPQGGYRDLILGGELPEWQSEADVQETIDRVIGRLDELRTFIRVNKNRGLRGMTIVSSYYADEDQPESSEVDRCNVRELGMGKFEVSVCPDYKQRRFVTDRADWESLQAAVAGTQMYFVLASAYDLKGTLTAIKAQNLKEETKNTSLTDKELVSIYSRYQTFGKLRRAQRLAALPNLAADALSGARWLKQNESRLCQIRNGHYGLESEGVKRPNNLFTSGACISPGKDEEFTNLGNKIDVALTGAVIVENLVVGGSRAPNLSRVKKNVELRPLALINQPIADLKTLFPSQFNDCGSALNLGDETFGKLFVSEKASTYLLHNKYCK